MNYEKHYSKLIKKALKRGKPDGYSEKHHITPRCLQGKDHISNYAYLTAKEHCLAHLLLVKLNPLFPQLAVPAHFMRKGMKRYEEVKKNLSLLQKLRLGKLNSNYGNKWTEEKKTKLSQKLKGRNAWNKGIKGSSKGWGKGYKHSEKSKIKMAISKKEKSYQKGDKNYFHKNPRIGELNSNAKIKTNDVINIRILNCQGYSLKLIASLFPIIPYSTISHVINYITWRNI